VKLLKEIPQKDGLTTEYFCGLTVNGRWSTRVEKYKEFINTKIGRYILDLESNIKDNTPNKGIVLLANKNTNERVGVLINATENNIQTVLNESFGENWVKVGELCLGDILRFTNENIYQNSTTGRITILQELIKEFENIKQTKCKTIQEMLFFDGVLAIIESKYIEKEMETEAYREKAMRWWNSMTFEEKFYKTINANCVLIGDTVDNHPDRLTGREIELIFEWHLSKP
jgi:hypothetical protein